MSNEDSSSKSNQKQTDFQDEELESSVRSNLSEGDDLFNIGELDIKGLVYKVTIGFFLILGAVGFVGYYFRGPLVSLSGKFVQAFGGFGVAGGFFLVDSLTFPLPNDAFSFFGLQGGMSFWVVIFWSFLGSLMGGTAAYGIGLALRRNKRFLAFMEGRGAETYNLIRRHGLLALFIAALTPVPYSIASYACGVVRIHFGLFFLVSFARIPRIAFYLWVIQKGMISFSLT